MGPLVMAAVKAAAPYAAMALPSIINLFSSSGGGGSKDEMMASIGPVAKKMAEETGMSEQEAQKALAEAMMPHVERMGGGGMGAMEALATIAGIAIPGVIGYKAARSAQAAAKLAMAGEKSAMDTLAKAGPNRMAGLSGLGGGTTTSAGTSAEIAGSKVARVPVTQTPSNIDPSTINVPARAALEYNPNAGPIRQRSMVMAKERQVIPPSEGVLERGKFGEVTERGLVPQGNVQTRIGRGMEQFPETGNIRTYDVENMLGPSRQGSPYLSAPEEFPKISNADLDARFAQLLRGNDVERMRQRMSRY